MEVCGQKVEKIKELISDKLWPSIQGATIRQVNPIATQNMIYPKWHLGLNREQWHSLLHRIYCPQSFSGGGLYSSGNGLLLIVYDWLLWLWFVCNCNVIDLVTVLRKFGWLLLCVRLLCAIWVIHTGAKSGGELVTLLSHRRLLLPSVSYMGHEYRCQILGWAGNAFVR